MNEEHVIIFIQQVDVFGYFTVMNIVWTFKLIIEVSVLYF